MCDGDGRIVDANDRACAWTDRGRDALLGRALRDLFVLDEAAFDLIWDSLRRDGRVRHEATMTLTAGTSRVVDVSIRTTAGEPVTWYCAVLRDVTTRVRAERAQARQARLHAALGACAGLLAQHSSVVDLCQAVCTAVARYGQLRSVTIGLVDPARQTLTTVAQASTNAVSTERPTAALSTLSLPLRRAGRLLGALGLESDDADAFGRDELPLAEALAAGLAAGMERASRLDRLERTCALLDESRWDWNMTTGALFVSPTIEEWLGYGPGELVRDAQSWLDVVHPRQRDSALVRLQALCHPDGNSVSGHLRLRHRSGDYRRAFVRARLVPDALSSEVTRLVGTVAMLG
jgi:PAS domain S-box-containing protein